MQKGQISKEKIKHEAARLFHRQGYNNTSINDILGSSGTKKGSLYFHYESKQTLFIDVLNDALSYYEAYLNSHIEHEKSSEKLEDILTAAIDFHIKGDISRGCFFGNIALEVGHDDSEISQNIIAIFKRWEDRYMNLLIQAEKNGEMRLKEAPLVLARTIIAIIEGGVLLSKINGSTKPLLDCAQFITSIIDERKIKENNAIN